MRFATTVIAVVSIALPALSSLLPRPGQSSVRYIVTFKNANAKVHTLAQLTSYARMTITHDWEIIPGIAGNFDSATLEAFRNSPAVQSVEEDGIASTAVYPGPGQLVLSTEESTPSDSVIQTDAPWGLARLSSSQSLAGKSDRALGYNYSYDKSAGAGVDVYVVDTGVETHHHTFGGRARWGATFGEYESRDGNGHGTHVAGTIAGDQFGVAKQARIVAVKVLSDAGFGSWTDVISGLNWVSQRAAVTLRPSIVSMSLSGGRNDAVDAAVDSLAAQGVHVVVAAGNFNMDAEYTSPARATGAITVGASTIDDEMAWFSNYGAPVAVFAPGLNVISSWPCANATLLSISGTSMATPHISGLVAYLIALHGNISPSNMKLKLQKMSLKNVVTAVPSGTVNYLAHI